MAEEIINKNVSGIGFGFYTGEEIKRLSVKRITVPFSYDALDNPIPNGFYDPKLGAVKNFETYELARPLFPSPSPCLLDPTDPIHPSTHLPDDAVFGLVDRCVTCGLTLSECPGHLGHIELTQPVYNITLMPLLLQLLRSKCMTCHHFRMGRLRVSYIASPHRITSSLPSPLLPSERTVRCVDINMMILNFYWS